jgi:hypothetical protein
MSSAPQRICLTRAIKNLNYIERSVPPTITKEDLKELTKLSPDILVKLHTISKPHEVIKNAKLANFLESNKIPLPEAAVSQPLFSGTLVFVQLTFNRPSQPPFSISNADLQTAINYSSLAAVPIHQYALQYGPNTINVSPNIMQFTVTLTGNTFSDADLRGWIETIVHDNNLTNSCMMILINTSGPRNTNATGSVGGYHSMTDNIPYCFCNVFGNNLTVADRNNDYALILSHEIAEMLVDPRVNNGNPEVCDGCAGNCSNVWNDFFDSNNNFIAGSNIVPPAFGYSFFINSIMRPACIDPISPEQCSKTGADSKVACVYAPPALAVHGVLSQFGANSIVGVGGYFDPVGQQHVVIVGTTDGKVYDLWWQGPNPATRELLYQFGANRGVGGYYAVTDKNQHAIVGTGDGRVNELCWQGPNPADQRVLRQFGANSIVGVGGYYTDADKNQHAIVGTRDGRVHELYWPVS